MIEALRARLRRLLKPGRCRWCDVTISSGLPTYPFCSERCREEEWQAQAVY